ncbi:MAG: hypothetical protein ACI8ZF_000903 [Candidatus Midichloriaceae bacterium]|jgi:hypothetical protein
MNTKYNYVKKITTYQPNDNTDNSLIIETYTHTPYYMQSYNSEGCVVDHDQENVFMRYSELSGTPKFSGSLWEIVPASVSENENVFKGYALKSLYDGKYLMDEGETALNYQKIYSDNGPIAHSVFNFSLVPSSHGFALRLNFISSGKTLCANAKYPSTVVTDAKDIGKAILKPFLPTLQPKTHKDYCEGGNNLPYADSVSDNEARTEWKFVPATIHSEKRTNVYFDIKIDSNRHINTDYMMDGKLKSISCNIPRQHEETNLFIITEMLTDQFNYVSFVIPFKTSVVSIDDTQPDEGLLSSLKKEHGHKNLAITMDCTSGGNENYEFYVATYAKVHGAVELQGKTCQAVVGIENVENIEAGAYGMELTMKNGDFLNYDPPYQHMKNIVTTSSMPMQVSISYANAASSTIDVKFITRDCTQDELKKECVPSNIYASLDLNSTSDFANTMKECTKSDLNLFIASTCRGEFYDKAAYIIKDNYDPARLDSYDFKIIQDCVSMTHTDL